MSSSASPGVERVVSFEKRVHRPSLVSAESEISILKQKGPSGHHIWILRLTGTAALSDRFGEVANCGPHHLHLHSCTSPGPSGISGGCRPHQVMQLYVCIEHHILSHSYESPLLPFNKWHPLTLADGKLCFFPGPFKAPHLSCSLGCGNCWVSSQTLQDCKTSKLDCL